VESVSDRYGEERLEAACNKALRVGDPAYKTVKGILVAGTENEAVQPALPGLSVPAFLHGPDAFGEEGR
jgi:hypothetical protein